MRNSDTYAVPASTRTKGVPHVSLYKSRRRLARTQEARAADHADFEPRITGCRPALSLKVILGLVQGKSPPTIAEGGLCSASQVYRVAHRFIDQGPQGLPDRREDNG